ncbi:N-acetylmuramoyl-L-alanine amidase [Pedosphaera parvula]|nr:N-acetylmuramoyl-L-alanine amidase [Pedosphaera parvula]
MRVIISTLLLFAFLKVGGVVPASGTASKLEKLVLPGRGDVRLSEWAKVSGFDIHWLKKDQSLQLTKDSSKLLFGVDSREAEVNGVNVWLSHPIVLVNGNPYISELDIHTALEPVLAPPKNFGGGKVKTIVIDPGHGGKDPGFQDGPQQEKKFTLLLAQELCSQLKQAGFEASLTRTTDTLIDLPVRPEIAKRRGADLFISLHWNSAPSSRNEVRGVETYCLTPAGASSFNAGGELFGSGTKPGNRFNDKNMYLAYQIQKSLLTGLAADDRGVKRARYAVLRTAEMPAILIEGGFMSHPAESKRIYDAVYRKQMARAIVNGITSYKKQVELVKKS